MDVILTAGKTEPEPPADLRKQRLKALWARLRDPSTSDEDGEDALEAIVQLSKE